MKLMKVLAGIATVGVLALGFPEAAAAEPSPPPETSTTTIEPMVSGGFLAGIAEANGYRIVTHPDGSRSSVPVTDAAKAQQAVADAARAAYLAENTGEVVPFGVVDGDCGSSWLNVTKRANDTLTFSTGYVVWGAVVDSQWTIYADAWIQDQTRTLYPGANVGNWSSEGSINNVVGPGVAIALPVGSFAILASGQVCYSGGPTSNFG